MRIILLLAVAAAGLATACASTATPYQVASGKSGYGFTETQIESNRARLSFSGNPATELTTVKKYVLFRAAETTLQHGYDYFVIMDRGVEQETEYRVSGPVRPRMGGGTLEQSGAAYNQVVDVTMFRGAKPAILPNAYDAREVVMHLEDEIERPQES
jgi:hypothetical protein